MTEKYRDIASARQIECAERADFFDKELRLFSKTNWFTVLIPSLLGVLAGSSLLVESNSIFLGIKVSTLIGLGTLLAACLTAIHKGLDCDAYQAECRRLVQEYRNLEIRYRTLAQIETPSIIEELLALDSELGELRQSQTATINPE
jgi:hypothetical protein